MENILLPSKMNFTQGENANEYVMTIEPLHYGYGTTIGNTLRRVLLSSLEGAAVTAVKIKGAQHEFSTIAGVKEDALEVIMNLKKLRLRVHSDQPVTIRLEVNGRIGAVTAEDFEANADVEIVNKDLTIATLTDKKESLIMDVVVQKGRGFLPTEEMDTTGFEIGLMAVDALFSPVVKVGMRVENTRVGEITNYDKLVMNITTDGTLTGVEAVSAATKIIQDHVNWIFGQVSADLNAGKINE
jgi:DNA-directed RNA polymerase subunit alpha